jgi:hypothetical protein
MIPLDKEETIILEPLLVEEQEQEDVHVTQVIEHVRQVIEHVTQVIEHVTQVIENVQRDIESI